jgi:cell division protein FtsB
LIPKILEIAQLIDGQEYIDRVEHEFDDEESKPKYYNGYYAAELSYLRIGNDALASEANNLRAENEALKAQLMELNNGVLPEPLPDFSSLLLVREPKPLAKQNRRKKRKDIIFVE